MMTTLIAAVVGQDSGWWDHMGGWDGGWMWLWGTLMMLTWLAVIAGAVWLVVRGLQRPEGGGGRGRAREILDERYARGELSTEEYRERLEALR